MRLSEIGKGLQLDSTTFFGETHGHLERHRGPGAVEFLDSKGPDNPVCPDQRVGVRGR